MEERHLVKYEANGARVVAMDSITHANETYGPGDVLVGASFMGVVAVQFATRVRPRAIICSDCSVGADGAGLNGLWYAEGFGIAAAAADGLSATLGDGEGLYARGRISTVNFSAEAMGAEPGMSVERCARLFADVEPVEIDSLVERCVTVYEGEDGRIVASDSIRFAGEASSTVVCVGSHGGRTAVAYAMEVGPKGFISNDGGMGLDGSGVSGLATLDEHGIPGASVSVHSARIGDGVSTYRDGIVSVVNDTAAALGVRVGLRASSAARLMLGSG